MARNATAEEVRGAQAFLKQIGADFKSNYLILAVVAWLHQESGGLRGVVGNNPFNLRPGKDDAKWRIGTRHTKRIGSFSIYATMEDGFAAAAARLVSAGKDWRGYDKIVKAFRHGGGNADAIAALNALALSAWDAAHYGLPNANHLLVVYGSFTGLVLPQPKPKPAPTPKPKPPPKPKPVVHLPRVLRPPVYRRETYGDAFRVLGFYRAKHPAE